MGSFHHLKPKATPGCITITNHEESGTYSLSDPTWKRLELHIILLFYIVFAVAAEVKVIGNQILASSSGVDVSGATFLMNDVILTQGVVFAYSAFFRSNKPLRFQIWRPQSLHVSETKFTLIGETRVIPSVLFKREDVSLIQFNSIQFRDFECWHSVNKPYRPYSNEFKNVLQFW